MSEDQESWDMQRAEKLRSSMNEDEIAELKARGQADVASLTVDEAGVLFLITRERIREFERLARDKGGKS
jgi:DNA-directed RNA polymerase sigma subunit (sigma70/sigma32)